MPEEEGKVCFEKSAIDHIQRLTHKSFSKMQDTSARIKRNFLIKTKIAVCLRSVFLIGFRAHLCVAAWAIQGLCRCLRFVLSAATLWMAVAVLSIQR